MVITLYKKGITTREIADLLEKMYGNHYSPTTISNISKVMKIEIEAYHNRKIKKDFIVLYCDATYLPVRRDSVAKDAKLIYNSDNIDIAEKRLAEILKKWSRKYPKLRKMLEGKNNLFTFMLFPKAIRRSLYTNNICENFNKDIKRKLKQKVQFPNEESLDKAIYIPVSEYNNKFSNRTHLGFGLVRYELKMMIEEISDSPNTQIYDLIVFGELR